MIFRLVRSLVLVLLCIFGVGALFAEKVADLPRPTNYVSDFAGVLSPQTAQGLDSLCARVDRQAHAQIAVVTIKSLDGEPIENFATDLEDKWKVGKKGTDRGVVLIFAIQDRRRWIETGYGLEGILPDSKVGVIGRSIVPALKAGNYDQGISSAVIQVAQVIAADAGVDLQANAPRRGPPQRQAKPISLAQLLIGAAALFVVIALLAKFAPSGTLGFLLGMIIGNSFGGGGRGGGDGDGDGGGFGGFGGGSSGGGGAGGDW